MSKAPRVLALVEVLLAFAAVHVTYRTFKHFTPLGRREAAAGLNFSPGAVMILFTVVVVLLHGRSFARYGLTARGWRTNLTLGLMWGVLVVAAAGLVVAFAPISADPHRPPDATRAIVGAAGGALATCLLAWSLSRQGGARRLPAPVVLTVLVILLCLPLGVALYANRPVLPVLLTVFWLFFGAGFGEEVFFRGYVQSRVDEAFGRPFRLLEVPFGWGLLVSACLFGLIHVLNTVDYFGGRLDFAWWWWLPNFAAGLFFGVLRERTGSALAGGIVHGLADVLAELPGLLP